MSPKKQKKQKSKKAVARKPLKFRRHPRLRRLKMPSFKRFSSRIKEKKSKVTRTRYKDVILILDFGSQYTQLIARRIRENKVFSRIVPFNITPEEIAEINPKGLIFSGGPQSVYDKDAPLPNKEIFKLGKPILGICYGMQVITYMLDGKVKDTKEREYGRAELFIDSPKYLFENLSTNLTCWMSHGDEVKKYRRISK